MLLFLIALVAAGLITPIMRRLAFHFNVIDRPLQEHKTHLEPIPYLGGFAIIIAVISVVLLGTLLVNLSFEVRKNLQIILFPCLLMGIIGLIDDIKNLSPISRFVSQTLAGSLAAFAIISTDNLGSPTGIVLFDMIISLAWIVGITNAINFFDNHDGGAAGTISISSFCLGILSFFSSQYYIGALCFVLAGASSGFLIWNKSPARIYMGDSGSLFLGMLISTLLLRFEPTPTDRLASFAVPIFILAFPILDTSVAVLSRLARGVSPFRGGQDHLSHRLVRRGNSRKKTAFKLWIGTAVFSAIALMISFAPDRWEEFLSITGACLWLFLFVWFFRQEHQPTRKSKR